MSSPQRTEMSAQRSATGFAEADTGELRAGGSSRSCAERRPDHSGAWLRSLQDRPGMKENLEIFDFELEPEDNAAISVLDKGEAGRTGPNPGVFAHVPR
jgi:hypothetical protein